MQYGLPIPTARRAIVIPIQSPITIGLAYINLADPLRRNHSQWAAHPTAFAMLATIATFSDSSTCGLRWRAADRFVCWHDEFSSFQMLCSPFSRSRSERRWRRIPRDNAVHITSSISMFLQDLCYPVSKLPTSGRDKLYRSSGKQDYIDSC